MSSLSRKGTIIGLGNTDDKQMVVVVGRYFFLLENMIIPFPPESSFFPIIFFSRFFINVYEKSMIDLWQV